MLVGNDALKKLKKARVAVFGVGGVGGYAAEALARAGVGEIDLVDNDTVNITNLNRQIIALESTIGMLKTDAMALRISDINPDIKVNKHSIRFDSTTKDTFDFSSYDYVVDAIDTVTSKIELIMCCKEHNTPIICAMGAGNKTDASKFEITDIYKTHGCPLAKVMRHELKKRGVKKLKVVYSTAEIIKPKLYENGKSVTASISYVPPVAGLLLAQEVILSIISNED